MDTVQLCDQTISADVFIFLAKEERNLFHVAGVQGPVYKSVVCLSVSG